MNHLIGIPAATLTVQTAAVMRLRFTRTLPVPVPDSPWESFIGRVQSVFVFTGRMKGTGKVRLFQGASCPFLFGVSNG